MLIRVISLGSNITISNYGKIRILEKKNGWVKLLRQHSDKNNSGHSLLGLAWKSAPDAFKSQMKCILLKKRPCDISVVRLRDLICRVYQSVNDVSVCLHFSERKKKTLRFLNNMR